MTELFNQLSLNLNGAANQVYADACGMGWIARWVDGGRTMAKYRGLVEAERIAHEYARTAYIAQKLATANPECHLVFNGLGKLVGVADSPAQADAISQWAIDQKPRITLAAAQVGQLPKYGEGDPS